MCSIPMGEHRAVVTIGILPWCSNHRLEKDGFSALHREKINVALLTLLIFQSEYYTLCSKQHVQNFLRYCIWPRKIRIKREILMGPVPIILFCKKKLLDVFSYRLMSLLKIMFNILVLDRINKFSYSSSIHRCI